MLHYAKLSWAMRAPWVDRFLNNEIYCFDPLGLPGLEGIVTSGRQQHNDITIGSDCDFNNIISKYISLIDMLIIS